MSRCPAARSRPSSALTAPSPRSNRHTVTPATVKPVEKVASPGAGVEGPDPFQIPVELKTRRDKIANEILTTEQSYVYGLNVLSVGPARPAQLAPDQP